MCAYTTYNVLVQLLVPRYLSYVGTVQYRHVGVTTEDGVDMRAEVALLSRNIRIHGEMQRSCYADNLCDYFNYDTFGGHIQVARRSSCKSNAWTNFLLNFALCLRSF